jgi:hypothetical protein
MSNPPDDLLRLPPEELLAWVQERLSGAVPYPEGFNWHGLAVVAGAEARDQDASPAWSEISVRTYAWLARRPGELQGFNFTHSEMNVRAGQILLHGAEKGHTVRDPIYVMEWFQLVCNVPAAEAHVKAENWRQLPKEEILRLRQMKNCLRAVMRLLGVLNQSDREEIQRWSEVPLP